VNARGGLPERFALGVQCSLSATLPGVTGGARGQPSARSGFTNSFRIIGREGEARIPRSPSVRSVPDISTPSAYRLCAVARLPTETRRPPRLSP
jgi:hypothetical protein